MSLGGIAHDVPLMSLGGRAQVPLITSLGGRAQVPLTMSLGGRAQVPLTMSLGGRAQVPLTMSLGGRAQVPPLTMSLDGSSAQCCCIVSFFSDVKGDIPHLRETQLSVFVCGRQSSMSDDE